VPLFDTGLLRLLREAAFPAIGVLSRTPSLRSALGGAFENQVAVDLLRQGETLAGWKRASAGSEIDFVHRVDDDLAIPIECKASLRADGRHLRGLRAHLDDYPVHTGVVVSFAPFEVKHFADGKRVVWLPAYATERLSTLVTQAAPAEPPHSLVG